MGHCRRLSWVLLAACGPALVDDPGAGTDSTSGSSMTDASSTQPGTSIPTSGPSETTATTTVPTTTGPLDTGSSADDSCPPDESDDGGVHLDVGPPPHECDLFAQDCDEGAKCVPDGYWSRVCVPLEPDPIADGESCDAVFGADPCGPLSWCWSGSDTCVPLCTGTVNDPQCPPETICVIDDEAVVAICQRPCDPFATTCPEFMTCQPTAQGFGCLPSGGASRGAPCFEQDSCGGGLACVDGDQVEGCCSARCCTALCSDEVPCAQGTCEAYGPAAPGPDGIGYCVQVP